MHAFIIEDDYLIAQSLRDMLEQLGFRSFTFAESEDAAVLKARGRRFDLITADVRLLPGDGVNAVRTIAGTPGTPVIFITGYGEDVYERMPNAVVIQKPVKQEVLARAVRMVSDGLPAPAAKTYRF